MTKEAAIELMATVERELAMSVGRGRFLVRGVELTDIIDAGEGFGVSVGNEFGSFFVMRKPEEWFEWKWMLGVKEYPAEAKTDGQT